MLRYDVLEQKKKNRIAKKKCEENFYKIFAVRFMPRVV